MDASALDPRQRLVALRSAADEVADAEQAVAPRVEVARVERALERPEQPVDVSRDEVATDAVGLDVQVVPAGRVVEPYVRISGTVLSVCLFTELWTSRVRTAVRWRAPLCPMDRGSGPAPACIVPCAAPSDLCLRGPDVALSRLAAALVTEFAYGNVFGPPRGPPRPRPPAREPPRTPVHPRRWVVCNA